MEDGPTTQVPPTQVEDQIEFLARGIEMGFFGGAKLSSNWKLSLSPFLLPLFCLSNKYFAFAKQILSVLFTWVLTQCEVQPLENVDNNSRAWHLAS